MCDIEPGDKLILGTDTVDNTVWFIPVNEHREGARELHAQGKEIKNLNYVSKFTR